MPGYRITPRARADLLSIGRYTESQWDKSRRNEYLKKLEVRFNWLAADPRLGRDRSDVAPGYRSFADISHVIFYVISANGIDIIGVPHKAMDVISYFSND